MSENRQDEVRLALYVAVNLAGTLFRKLLLQAGIRRGIVRTEAEMIPKCDVISKRNTSLWADVKVVSRLILRCPERLSIFDSEISAMFVSQASEPRHGQGQIPSRRNHDVQVDYWLGCKTGNCSASHMLNRDGDVAHGWPDSISELKKVVRPFEVVFHHLNESTGNRHVHSSMVDLEYIEVLNIQASILIGLTSARMPGAIFLGARARLDSDDGSI